MSKKKLNSNSIMKIVLIVGVSVIASLIVAIIALIIGIEHLEEQPETPSGQTQGATNEKIVLRELVVHSVEEQGDVVVVETSYGTLEYPFAFSDLIQVKADNSENSAALEFSADINGTVAKLFTIRFNDKNGIPVGTWTVAEKDKAVIVSVEFYEADGTLGEADLITFHATKETFNDIVNSLADNKGFTPAD